MTIAAALTRLDGPGARGLLRERALGDDDPGRRMQALNALAASAGERSVNILGRALRPDFEPKVRMTALRALGRVGGDSARHALKRATRDVDPEISLAAEEALAAGPSEEWGAMPRVTIARRDAGPGWRPEAAPYPLIAASRAAPAAHGCDT